MALAGSMAVAPTRAEATPREHRDDEGDGRPPVKQGRRRAERGREGQTQAPVRSPCGRHSLSVERGEVRIDGRRVHERGENVYLLGAPAWRRDGSAVAWMERSRGNLRLVVVPDVAAPGAPLTWDLPASTRIDEVAWAGTTRVVVGETTLAPRAVATWSES
jgi:hypothetical protein